MKAKLTIFSLLTLISSVVYGQDWQYAGSSDSGDKYFLKNSSVTIEGNKKVWSKRIGKTITYTKGGKKYTIVNGHMLALHEYNCEQRQSKLLSAAFYNSKGTLVYSLTIQEYLTEWTDVVPDSIGEMLLEKVCELF